VYQQITIIIKRKKKDVEKKEKNACLDKRSCGAGARMRGVRKRLVLLGLGILLSAWLNFSFFTLTSEPPPPSFSK
jgi:hypothetical protein